MAKPLVSVVIPIYNVSEYISAAINSVIQQTINISNMEIILVDDGSTDGSSEIATEFAKRYPQNIIYKRQVNRGVSAARNRGLRLAKGRYIHFFDADDILSNDFYEQAVKFFDAHHHEIDFVATKLKFFDEIIDSHPLNYKFKTSRVIDITNEPNNPILHVISAVFRRAALDGIHFDERLSIAEDVKFLSDVLIKKKKYGVLKSPVYHYRKRSSGGSAIGGKERNRDYYLSVPALVYHYMLDSWQKAGGVGVAEYTILYDLSYRLGQKSQSILSQTEQRHYKKSIKDLLLRCSDEAILLNNYLSVHQKIYALRHKHGQKFDSKVNIAQGKATFAGQVLYDYHKTSISLDFMNHYKDDRYEFEGYVDGPIDLPSVTHTLNVSGEHTVLKSVPRAQREQSFLGDIYYNGGAFVNCADLKLTTKVSFAIIMEDMTVTPRLNTGSFTNFGALAWTYRRSQDRLFMKQPDHIRSYPYQRQLHVYLELRMLAQIALNWRVHTMRERFAKLRTLNLANLTKRQKIGELLKPFFFSVETILYIPRAFYLRAAYYATKRHVKKPIWIISDRGMAAGDNGEALFRYTMMQPDCPADVFFVLSKKSRDLHRLRSIGPVLIQESLRYKLKFLLADKIISSQADVETTNPFIRQLNHYVDLFNFDFIFLQHGIIRHDLSSWLNRYNKNISLFITSAAKEYNSILSNPYYYSSKNILLSGMPRYDYLENKPNRKLILAPTYRKNLIKMPTDKNGQRRYDAGFATSTYREFYNKLMNDPLLLESLRSAGMKGEFYLHPNFSAQRQDFDENDAFTVMEFPYDYQKAFREGELLISDHSSVMFDFAYLKKPVVYAHFDVETFFDGHSYDPSNFFSDEDNGFGAVYYNYHTLLQGVVSAVETGCKMEDKYKKRVDEFFYKVDKKNCQRVYNAIVASSED